MNISQAPMANAPQSVSFYLSISVNAQHCCMK